MAARRKPSAQHNPPRRPESDPTRVLRSEIRDRPRRERTVAAPLLHRVSSNLSEDARRALLAMGTTDVVAASTPRNPPPPRPNRGDEAVPDATTAQAARRAANLRKMHRAGKNRPDPAPRSHSKDRLPNELPKVGRSCAQHGPVRCCAIHEHCSERSGRCRSWTGPPSEHRSLRSCEGCVTESTRVHRSTTRANEHGCSSW